ncbi:filamentous hemagglutinin N-terminal domain-containing protein, partial [Nitrosomonas communis]|uniref:two-partner secretion domain-containing protein n=1 Tax=Nitrosomonas communis TaxID=44574 RepID=UPI003D29AA4A
MQNNRFQSSILSIPIILSLQGVMIPLSYAEITLDGTLGHNGLLAGPDFVIPAEAGKQLGDNLFHSFGVFDVDTGESATFTGPNSVHHILGRVTGGSRSTIDGLLRSEIPGANLYLINPAGMMFGPHAELNVQGSFHTGTADFIRLGENGRFDATHPENSVLAIAPPSAFGFLGENPTGISIEQSRLGVEAGKTLSLVGGDIKMVGGTLSAPSGRINMSSATSKGEVTSDTSHLATESFNKFGKIDITQEAKVEVSGGGGESIFIRGGIFTLSADSGINTSTASTDPASNISIIITDSVSISDGSKVESTTKGQGDAGDLSITAGTLEIGNGAVINASTSSTGKGGDLSVEADHVLLSGNGVKDAGTGIVSQALGSGDAGFLSFKAGTLEIRNGAFISGDT